VTVTIYGWRTTQVTVWRWAGHPAAWCDGCGVWWQDGWGVCGHIQAVVGEK
jgi:hypothetical protein